MARLESLSKHNRKSFAISFDERKEREEEREKKEREEIFTYRNKTGLSNETSDSFLIVISLYP